MNKGTSDKIRSVLIDFKHEKRNLGDSMREIKNILKKSNEKFFYEGRIRNAIDRHIILQENK